MKIKLWKLPAALLALGLSLALTGCPVSVDDRNDDLGGPGRLFGNVSAPVTIAIRNIPAEHNGYNRNVTFAGFGTLPGRVNNGHLVVTFPNVTNPTSVARNVILSGGGLTGTATGQTTTLDRPTLIELDYVTDF